MDLLRANKLTVYFSERNVMVGIFYKTNTKLGSVDSTDKKVKLLGYKEPISIDVDNKDGLPATYTPSQDRLRSFREFLILNATAFGYVYDPVDRRAENEKYPSQYNEDLFYEYSAKVVKESLNDVINQVQERTIDKMVEQGHLHKGCQIRCILSEEGITIETNEMYKNGFIKYATASFPVKFGITTEPTMVDTKIDVNLVSGQLKKPRTIGEYVFTAHGIKTMLVDAKILPKIEKPKEEENDSENDSTDCKEDR